MTKISNTMFSSLKLGVVLIAVAMASGCISAKGSFSAVATPASSGSNASLTYNTRTADGSYSTWTVTKGNNLWGIAGNSNVYNVPESWPLIYKNNLDQIDDADLIYPGQVLDIPRNSSAREISAAIRHARSRGAWTVGSTELSDKVYLRNSQ